MKKTFSLAILAIFSLALALLALQTASAFAYVYYEPDYYYGSPHFSYFYDYDSGYGGYYISLKDRDYYDVGDAYGQSYYWDPYELKWRKDPVQKWINKGESWRERVKRARAVNFLLDSWDKRYAIASGKTSEQVLSYTDGATDTVAESSSNWRYKETYDPLTQGIDPYKNYYYQPRYDSKTQTYNWRY